MEIYKVLLPSEWGVLEKSGQTMGAPIDVSDGYVHFSTAEQLRETVSKHFTHAPELELLACDSKFMRADITWEPSRGGALFPHLYRHLLLSDVEWRVTVKLGDQGHILPDVIP
jgi:uncharacterized protein (DUF952 family)